MHLLPDGAVLQVRALRTGVVTAIQLSCSSWLSISPFAVTGFGDCRTHLLCCGVRQLTEQDFSTARSQQYHALDLQCRAALGVGEP